jgi:hypothetical protein
LLKAQSWVRVHWGSLNKRLELVTWVSWCPFKSKYLINWLFS